MGNSGRGSGILREANGGREAKTPILLILSLVFIVLFPMEFQMPAKIAQDRNNLAFSLLLATVLLAFAAATASASSIVNTIVGFNGPIGIAVSPFGSQAYVVNNGNNTVS